jgi:hypothetical protein
MPVRSKKRGRSTPHNPSHSFLMYSAFLVVSGLVLLFVFDNISSSPESGEAFRKFASKYRISQSAEKFAESDERRSVITDDRRTSISRSSSRGTRTSTRSSGSSSGTSTQPSKVDVNAIIDKLGPLSSEVVELNSKISTETGRSRINTINSMRSTVKERRQHLISVMEENPSKAYDFLLPSSIIKTLPTEVKEDVEEPVSIEGVLELYHYDDFESQKSVNSYFLQSGGKTFNFFPTSDISLKASSGSTVKVDGYKVGNAVIAAGDDVSVQAQASGIPTIKTAGEIKTLVLLVRYQNSYAERYTAEDVHNQIFGWINDFMKEASYGKISFTGDVSGWHTLPRDTNLPGVTGCAFPTDAEKAKILVQEGIDITQYDSAIILASCAKGGFANLFRVMINGEVHLLPGVLMGVGDDFLEPFDFFTFPFNTFSSTISHELGHNLGLWHATYWWCKDSAIYNDNCEFVEYGNGFDTMGLGGHGSKHFNVHSKSEILGWLDESSMLTIDKSGTYTLNPLAASSGVRGARIKTADGKKTPFFVEFRQPIGFDGNLDTPQYASNKNGIFIYHWRPELYKYPLLLDMTPGPVYVDTVKEVTLNVGAPAFVDEGTGITIGSVIVDENEASFQVSVEEPECMRHMINMDGSLFFQPGYSPEIERGAKQFMAFSIPNFDTYSCGVSDFLIEVTPSPGFKVIKQSSSSQLDKISEIVKVESETRATFSFEVFALPENDIGDYPLTIKVKNLASGMEVIGTPVFKITTPPFNVDLKVQKPGEQPVDESITIPHNTKATLLWETNGATLCVISWTDVEGNNGWKVVDQSQFAFGAESTEKLTSDTTYTLDCSALRSGISGSDTVSVAVGPPVFTADLKINDLDSTSVPYDTPVTLSWDSTEAVSCNGMRAGSVDLNGDGYVNINDITLYTSQNPGISSDDTFLSKITAAFGTTTEDDWVGPLPVSGSITTENLVKDQTYTLKCTNSDGNILVDSETAEVVLPSIYMDLLVNGDDGPITIAPNSEATLSWTSTGSSLCSIVSDAGTVLYFGADASGEVSTGPLVTDTTFDGECSDAGVGFKDSVTVLVS